MNSLQTTQRKTPWAPTWTPYWRLWRWYYWPYFGTLPCCCYGCDALILGKTNAHIIKDPTLFGVFVRVLRRTVYSIVVKIRHINKQSFCANSHLFSAWTHSFCIETTRTLLLRFKPILTIKIQNTEILNFLMHKFHKIAKIHNIISNCAIFCCNAVI